MQSVRFGQLLPVPNNPKAIENMKKALGLMEQPYLIVRAETGAHRGYSKDEQEFYLATEEHFRAFSTYKKALHITGIEKPDTPGDVLKSAEILGQLHTSVLNYFKQVTGRRVDSVTILNDKVEDRHLDGVS